MNIIIYTGINKQDVGFVEPAIKNLKKPNLTSHSGNLSRTGPLLGPPIAPSCFDLNAAPKIISFSTKFRGICFAKQNQRTTEGGI